MTGAPAIRDPAEADAGAGDVLSAHAAFRAWLFDRALPFWADASDEGGRLGAPEHLRLDGSRADVPFKRMRVQARQIYVFSHAALLGWRRGERLASQGYAFICRRGELAAGGWARRLSREGDVLDDAADLYDLAFVLFALAWYIRLTGDEDAAARARRTTEWITTRMRAPHGGFHNVVPAEPGPRQQNPHMHLLEAMLALFETTGEAGYAEVARDLVDLFRRRLFDPATGALGEFFEADWSPAAGPAGNQVEPGHQFEWVWLLDQYERLTGATMAAEIESLYRFGRRYGVDRSTALVWDEVGRDGATHRRSSRLWPQAEALKAHAVMARRGGGGAPDAARAARNLLTRFLGGRLAGGWIDQFDAEGAPTAERIPTSSFYHILMGYAELDKLARDQAA